MSWDVSVESRSGPIGTADEVRKKISAALSEVDWSDPTMGFLEAGGNTFEFAILVDEDDEEDEDADDEDDAEASASEGAGALLSGFVVSVRGDGEPLPVLAKLCKAYGWSLTDADTGDDIDLSKESAPSWHEFTDFRDSVAKKAGGSKPGFFSRLFGRK